MGSGPAAAECPQSKSSTGTWPSLRSARGSTPRPILPAIWDRLYAASLPYGRKGVAIMALSGIDLALWDALGRAEGLPVKDLIGGPRLDSVPVYATGGDSEWYAELGITGQKIPHRWTGKESDYDMAEEQVAGVRRVLGPDADVMIDTYMTWTADVNVEDGRAAAGPPGALVRRRADA